MEMIKDIIVDFVLFSGIEGILYAMFYNKVCYCQKFNIFEIIIMSMGNCLISCIILPIFYQILMIVWMSFCLLLKERNFDSILKYIKYSVVGMIVFLVCETVTMFPLDKIFGINYNILSKFQIFICLIPTRILELLIILIGGHTNMKSWFGGVVRK